MKTFFQSQLKGYGAEGLGTGVRLPTSAWPAPGCEPRRGANSERSDGVRGEVAGKGGGRGRNHPVRK